MATSEEMSAQLDRLRDIRAKGILTYTIAGRTMTYRSDAELAAAIADLERRNAAASGNGPVRVVRTYSTKGF